jgi:hypothetical protein
MSRAKTMLAAMAAMEPRILGYLPEPKPQRIYTHADEERQAKAEAKRQRKAAKRVRQSGGAA